MLSSKMEFVGACPFVLLLLLLTSCSQIRLAQSMPASLTVSDVKYSFINGTNLRAVGAYLQKSTSSNNLDDNIELLQEALEEGVAESRSEGFVEIAKILIALGETSDEQVICTPDHMEFFRRVADEPTPGLRISLVVQKLLLKAKYCPGHLIKQESLTPEFKAELRGQFVTGHDYYRDLLETRLFRELQSAQTAQRGLENNVVFLSSMAKKIASAEYYRGHDEEGSLSTPLKTLDDYERAWERNFIEPCRHIVTNERLRRLASPMANLEIAAAKFNAWEADEFDSEHYLSDWANRYMTCNVLLGLNQKRLLSVMFMRETGF